MIRAEPEPAATLPTGLVTLLFTDIEGSTKLLHQLGDAYGEVLADHHRLLRAVWREHRGVEVGTEGDAFFVAFRDAGDAVAAAHAAQLTLRRHPWPRGFEVRVRMGIHRGTPQVRDAEYWGIDVHYAARVCAAAHGGQVLLSDSVADAVDVRSEDLGLHALKDFPTPRRLFHLLVDGVGSEAFPPIKALRAGRTNLPDQRSSLVGRRREIDEITTLLEHRRMVTLAGPGGVGKTRLALQVGAVLLDGSGDGVWLAELAGLADRHALVSSVANALGVTLPAAGAPLEAFAEQLADRRLLLVLDNCEHLLDAVAELADGLLRHCPSVKVLATSREPVGIAGETVYRVPSLDVPAEAADPEAVGESQAVQLLVERAAAHRRGFVLDDTNAAALATIARRLDGIPLAIELAAAWLRRLSVAELCARLERGFELLTGVGRMTPSRQQTIQAVIDWSYDLLTSDEQRLLDQLSVFAGGFDLAAAEDVCGESIGTEVIFSLGALADKSLVQVQDTRGELRYRLLETVRAYAGAKLQATDPAEAGQVREAHLRHYLAIAEAMHQEPDGHRLPAWLDRIAIEHDNMRAALAHSLAASDPEPALRLAVALTRFRDDRGFSAESASDLARALARPGADRPTRARAAALVGLAGRYSFRTGDRQQLLDHSQEALEIAQTLGDDEVAARALGWRVYLLGRNGDWPAALDAAELAQSLAVRTGLARLISRVLVGKAGAMINLGRDARPVLAEAADLSRRNGDLAETARVLNQLGLAEISADEYAAARAALSEAREIATNLGLRGVRLVSLLNLGFAVYLDGDANAAAEHHRAALKQTIEDRDHGVQPYALLGIALSDTACGKHQQAAVLHGAVDALLASRDERLETLEARLHEQDVERLRGVLGDEQFAERHRTGAQKPIADVFAAALAADDMTTTGSSTG